MIETTPQPGEINSQDTTPASEAGPQIDRRSFLQGVGAFSAKLGLDVFRGQQPQEQAPIVGPEPEPQESLQYAQTTREVSQELRRDEAEASVEAQQLLIQELVGAENLRVIAFGDSGCAVIKRKTDAPTETIFSKNLSGGNTVAEVSQLEDGVSITFTPESPLAANGPLSLNSDEVLVIFPDQMTFRNDIISAHSRGQAPGPKRYSTTFFAS